MFDLQGNCGIFHAIETIKSEKWYKSVWGWSSIALTNVNDDLIFLESFVYLFFYLITSNYDEIPDFYVDSASLATSLKSATSS